jgi:hypothetical protein
MKADLPVRHALNNEGFFGAVRKRNWSVCLAKAAEEHQY